MRKHLWLAIAMLLIGVGCPSEFGEGGRIDKAMEQDMQDMKQQLGDCPAGMHWQKPKSPCTEPPCKPTCVADEN